MRAFRKTAQTGKCRKKEIAENRGKTAEQGALRIAKRPAFWYNNGRIGPHGGNAAGQVRRLPHPVRLCAAAWCGAMPKAAEKAARWLFSAFQKEDIL